MIIIVKIIVMKRSMGFFVRGSVGVQFVSLEIVMSFLSGRVIARSADFTRFDVGRK